MIYVINDCRDFPLDTIIKYFNLSKSEETRILSLKHSSQSLFARYACSYGIEKEYGLKNITFSVEESGKPFCENQNFYISLAHSQFSSLAAMSKSPIGADIEAIREYKEAVCEKYFSQSEKEYILSSKNKDIAYTTVLSLKESLAKFTGKGLSGVIKNASFEFSSGRFSCENLRLCFNVQIFGNYIVTSCCENEYDLAINLLPQFPITAQ